MIAIAVSGPGIREGGYLLAFALLAVVVAILVWEQWVLTRPHIRALFEPEKFGP